MEIKTLSSRLTLIYKWILPSFFGLVTLLIWVLAIALHNESDAIAIVVIGLFFTFFFLLMLPFLYIQKVWYDEKHLFISNYRKVKSVALKNVKGYRRWMFYFYKIDFTNEQGSIASVMILPHMVERFLAGMGTPFSLEDFEDKIGEHAVD